MEFSKICWNIVKDAIFRCKIIVFAVSYNVITDLIQQIWSCQTAKRSRPR